MRFSAAFPLFLLATAAPASSNVTFRPTRHELDITIKPEQQSMIVRDLITVPPEDIGSDGITFELADFIAQPQFRIVSGASGLNVRSREGDFGRLWTITPVQPSNSALRVEVFYRLEKPKSAQIAIGPEGSFAGSSGDAWYPQLDYSVAESGRLTFHVPSGQTVIATGTLVSSSAQEGRGEFVYDVGEPSKLAFAAARYHRYPAGDGHFSIYALQRRPEFGTLSRELSPSLRTLEHMYGPFPFGAPALVEVKFPTIVLGASEQGFILADSSEIVAHSKLYWIHEFAHQWWGTIVRPQSKTPAATLLTEGLAEFSALEVLKKLDGKDALRKLRVGQLASEEDSPIAQYDRLASRDEDRPLRNWTPANGDEALLMHRLATSKGAMVLAMLSDETGDDKVIGALRQLIERNRHGRINWASVEEVFSRAAGRDLGEEFADWLGRPGIADLRARWSQAANDGEVEGTVTQEGPAYEMPLDVELRGSATSGRSTKEIVQLNGHETAFSFKPGFEVREVRLDPEYRIFRRPLPSDLR